MIRSRALAIILTLTFAVTLPSPVAQAIDVYYQGVHQESSIKQQPPITFDRILGLYLSDRTRPFQLPKREGAPKDLLDLEKTIHLRLYSTETQAAIDSTTTQQNALQVVEAFVQTADLASNQLRAGKFVSQLQGALYPRTPYTSGFITPPQFVLNSFGAEGLTGIGFEWVRYVPTLIDITYQWLRSDHSLFAGPQSNSNFHSIGINTINQLTAQSSYSLALKAGALALGSEDEVALWTASLSYQAATPQGRGLKAKAEILSERTKSRKVGKVRGGYLFEVIAQLTPEFSLGLRRDAAGYQADSFDHVIRDAAVGTVWLSRDVALDVQKSLINPKSAEIYNQTHLQLRISLLKI